MRGLGILHLKEYFLNIWQCMTTKKVVDTSEKTDLKRVMSIFDLTFLGIGSMLGMGVYIMCGNLATTVGPAMIISFILAGIAATLSALCYAEFAGRAPGTGSAYCYCYITVGEFMAFVLGWNLALEFVIGTACLARGLSGYLDSIADGKMSEYMKEQLPIGVDVLSPYPDFLAFVIMVVFTCLVSVGVKESTIVNNILVVINLITIVVVIVSGFIKADIDNWSIVKTSLPEHFKHVDIGNGGFAPYGFSSILEGAATCFYAYTGFDTVATTGGEANNPQRAIPIALMLSMSIGILAYTCVSATFTLMWPFYDQNTAAPYPYILNHLGLTGVKWVVTVGALSAILGCIVGSIFGMARVVYSIAHDGLLCTPLGKVNKRTQTPLNATMVAGVLTGVIAIIFDADQLISMTSIGTLMAYSMVGVCVLILRYEAGNSLDKQLESEENVRRGLIGRLFNIPRLDTPTEDTGSIAKTAIYTFGVLCFALGAILAFGNDLLYNKDSGAIFGAVLFFALLVISMVIVARQPSSTKNLVFKVKPVPLLPAISVFINIYLMLKLDKMTWIRFAIWLVIGLLIYFSYGIWHSTEREYNKNKSDATAKKKTSLS